MLCEGRGEGKKVYDRVFWGFLDMVMEYKGFGERWRRWTRECFGFIWYFVIINGN